MKKYLFLCISLLVGCSTTPVTEDTGSFVTKDRIYIHSLLTPEQGKEAITVFRDSGISGSACNYDLSIDNQKIATLKSGEFIKFYAPYGEHIIKVSVSGLCPDIEITDTIQLKENKEAKYRILLPSDGSLRLSRIQ